VNGDDRLMEANSERRTSKNWLSNSMRGRFFLVAALLLVFVCGVAAGRGKLHIANLGSKKTAGSGLDGIKTGLVNSTGDPYTEYLNAKEAKEFNRELSGTFTGIGAELGTNTDNNIIIISPISGYPADKAGLKPRDIIAAINGQTTSGMSISAAVKKIRGPAGSKVTLSIVRGDGSPFGVNITRQTINVPSVESKVEGQIGYIKINQFTADTGELAQKAAQDLKNQNVKAIVLDLRGNPGGYLSAAVDVSSLWLNKGDVVVQQRRGGKTVVGTEYASGNNILGGLPTAVLINAGSASASEIVAGALHDHKTATLVGTTSFGKGSVQQVENLSGGAELKVTVAHWYTPNGKNINKQGINPDLKIEVNDQDSKSDKDPQKDQAYQLLQSKIH
jgi:carboxyl-terminal processing protease